MDDEQEKRNLQARTKAFALRIIRLHVSLPKKTEAHILGKQVLKTGPSAETHYRKATRGSAAAGFVSKIEGRLQKLEESVYWLELLIDQALSKKPNYPTCFKKLSGYIRSWSRQPTQQERKIPLTHPELITVQFIPGFVS